MDFPAFRMKMQWDILPLPAYLLAMDFAAIASLNNSVQNCSAVRSFQPHFHTPSIRVCRRVAKGSVCSALRFHITPVSTRQQKTEELFDIRYIMDCPGCQSGNPASFVPNDFYHLFPITNEK